MRSIEALRSILMSELKTKRLTLHKTKIEDNGAEVDKSHGATQPLVIPQSFVYIETSYKIYYKQITITKQSYILHLSSFSSNYNSVLC